MAGSHPPPYPWDQLKIDQEPSAQLRRERDAFGAYVIAAYCPYSSGKFPTLNYGDRLTLDWSGFIKYIDWRQAPIIASL